ncbi:30S ribosomal protein S21 [Winogradskyella vincentii]|uniref:Small ribosomal subunit protein bS21 n=1 Tax=Winogradskyella vincentii TaxID=2877122 RepID=A0ABS7XW50_9FLAO|nr:30S ribosomal protein S21 [Winogradskyella vincentii]MCA0151596.1 30S ribosomal protein S21 [Winogradskyella vincentii]
MLRIQVNEKENIERALKRYKRKFDKTGTKRQLQSRKHYMKPSEVLRRQLQKAEYIQILKDQEAF